MPNPKKKALGRGLSALISSAPSEAPTEPSANPPRRAFTNEPVTQTIEHEPMSDGSMLIEIDPHEIAQNPRQPRKYFDEDSLQELAQSIRIDGVLEPVIVRRKSDGSYELVSGERRVKASILADRETIPAVVRKIDDRELLKIGLIENIQREDLNPIETAQAYQALIQDFHWTQEHLADQVGKNRSTITNTLRLLNLEPSVQRAVLEGKITTGHAKALLAIDSPEKQANACRKVIDEGLSVRQAEKLAVPVQPRLPSTNGATPRTDPHIEELEDRIRRKLGTKVTVRSNEKYHGKLEIDFFGLEELERILALLDLR